ncbi:MAG: hypothetical protein A2Y87_08535 [Bacteroidetes bacterium RBG_13_46_8]|nr:MAG: hypothetical protein A2Y87_08535 [Bacteroidetes bacterium RBG_13_46_8]
MVVIEKRMANVWLPVHARVVRLPVIQSPVRIRKKNALLIGKKMMDLPMVAIATVAGSSHLTSNPQKTDFPLPGARNNRIVSGRKLRLEVMKTEFPSIISFMGITSALMWICFEPRIL